MDSPQVPPPWKLPPGVNAPLWRYAHSRALAAGEDSYFAGHPLLAADARFLAERFDRPGTLVDLGCGTGRLALAFARRGFAVTAVELSAEMLRVLGRAAAEQGLSIRLLQANLCRLGCLPDAVFDHALSMFSTLGMIRGPAARQRALDEAARILRPGGRLALHAHNVWINARSLEGWTWLASHGLRLLAGQADAFDRRMLYRGVPDMEVHLYRWGELKRSLSAAGLRIEEVRAIDAVTAQPIRLPGLAHGLRAGGWIVLARRSG